MISRIINQETDEALEYTLYRKSKIKLAFVWIFIAFSGGILYLVFYWKPEWKFLLTHYKSHSTNTTDGIYLTILDGSSRKFTTVVKYTSSNCLNILPHTFFQSDTKKTNKLQRQNYYSCERPLMTFELLERRFIWNPSVENFVQITGLDEKVNIKQLLEFGKYGISQDKQEDFRKVYGYNFINVTVPSYMKLFLTEVLNPFYVFQVSACVLWIVEQFVLYATILLVMSFISAVVSLIQVRRERQNLHDMVHQHNELKVRVKRNEFDEETIHTKDIVPGDVVIIPPGNMLMSFDAVLLTGTCVVNESMLTGESVPVTKTSIPVDNPDSIYSLGTHKLHTLFCGTEILQTRNDSPFDVKCVVVRTGYETAKGRLVHSIMYPKPTQHRVIKDTIKFMAVFAGIAVAGIIYTVIVEKHFGASATDIVFDALDIITTAVPPSLFLAITVGIVYAQNRLKHQSIHCISPQHINIAGQTNIVAFDKTGTLTEDTLDFKEVVSVTYREPSSHPSFQFPTLKQENLGNYECMITQCMATCHCLTYINEEIIGDPLEFKMFQATGWSLIEPQVVTGVDTRIKNDKLIYVTPKHKGKDQELEIVEQFPFASHLQRSMVVVRSFVSDDRIVFVKGAPEKVVGLCKSDSIPNNFEQVLESYTAKGYRVLALANKTIFKNSLPVLMEREILEKDLNLLGLVIMQNKLKLSTKGALEKLFTANIHCLMVTGDNLSTAISVAQDCGIVKKDTPILVAKIFQQLGDNKSLQQNTPFPSIKWERKDNTELSHVEISFSDSEEHSTLCKNENNILQSCHLAITGPQYNVIKTYFPEYIPALMVQGTIFARMSPKEKTSLIEDLKGVGYFVCMCGDGANDCGALKAAHTGISLSEFEASVAAPFTSSNIKGIESVVTLIREGRAALVTSFGMFKFMTLCSLIMFTTATFLYYELSIMSDGMYLYVDLCGINLISITMARNYAYKKLHHVPPLTSLVAPEMLVSILFQVVIQFCFQFVPYYFVKKQCWYSPTPTQATKGINWPIYTPSNCSALSNIANQTTEMAHDEWNSMTYETTCLFYVTSFMYASVSISFSTGPPYRTPIYKNKFYLASLIFIAVTTTLLMFLSPPEVNNFFKIRDIPENSFIFTLLAIAFTHLFVSLLFEIIFIENRSVWKAMCSSKSKKRTKFSTKHEKYISILSGTSPNDIDKIGIPWQDQQYYNHSVNHERMTDNATSL